MVIIVVIVVIVRLYLVHFIFAYVPTITILASFLHFLTQKVSNYAITIITAILCFLLYIADCTQSTIHERPH